MRNLMQVEPEAPPEPAVVGQREWPVDHMGYQNAVWHARLVAGIVASYPDAVYIEIGILRGDCFRAVAPFAGEAHGVDPVAPEQYGGTFGEDGRYWQMKSDEFFRVYDGPAPDVVFVDGEHAEPTCREDVQAALEMLAPGGVVVMHDTWPVDMANEVLSGQVWKVRRQLEADPAVECFTFPRFPGITIARSL